MFLANIADQVRSLDPPSLIIPVSQMINTNSTKKTEDLAEQRIKKLEQTVDNLRWHLLTALELNHALASQVALLTGQNPDNDQICKKALNEYNTLNTLRPVRSDFNRR